jgi:multiple sugar transport system substrate-binding protein
MISRRELIVGAAAGALLSRSRGSSTDSPKKSVSVLYFAGLAEGKRMRAAIPGFMSKTGIAVSFVERPYDAIRPTQHQSFNKTQGDYDVIFVDDVWMYEYAKKGYLRKLSPLVQRDGYDLNDMSPRVVEAEGRLNDEIWLIPQRADVQVLFYNKAIFEDTGVRDAFKKSTGRALGVPATWDEYVTTAKGLHGLPYKGAKIVGSAETLKRPHFAFEFFATRYWSISGQDFFDANFKPTFNSPGGVAALNLMSSLKHSWAPGSLNAAHDETVTAFSGGLVALTPQWFGFYSTFKAPDALGNHLGVAEMPGVALPDGKIRRAPSIGGGSLGIAANARSPDAAWEFIQFMTSPDMMTAGAKAGEIVTRRSAYRAAASSQTNPDVTTYLASLEIAKFRPRSIDYAAIESAIGEAVSRSLVGELAPADALAQAAQDVVKINARST